MKIGIFGFGGVGCALYNEMHDYKDLYILVDDKRYDKYHNSQVIINDVTYYPNYIKEGIMDLIIVSVKNYDLDKALIDMERFVNKKTIILPLLNGIRAIDRIKEYYKYNRVLYGCINVESNKIDNRVITSKIYNLQFGDEYNYHLREPLIKIKLLFNKYNINNNIYHNLKRRVWLKWCLNIGINQISALYNYTYKDMSDDKMLKYLDDIFDEVYKVSLSYNSGLTDLDIEELKRSTRDFKSDRVTSLTIDFNKGKENELNVFGFELIRLAKLKNIDVPKNEELYKKLKEKDDKIKEKAKLI